jgi:peroxiredoxin family protein
MAEVSDNAKSLSLIVTKGTLDWAYPPFILATTAAAMGLNVSMFFTFYGLPLLLKHMPMPSIVGVLPGAQAGATTMMKNLIKKKGVASIEELRDAAIESGVRMIACQMTMGLFEYEIDDMIAGPEIGGAATYIETACKSDINLFI